MIPVEELTEQNIEKRFSILPAPLQKALTSDENKDIALKICESNHIIDDDEVLIAQQLATLVMLGFLHPDDLSEEINNELGLKNPQLASAIAGEFKVKLFSHLQFDLEKNYKPISKEGSAPVVLTTSSDQKGSPAPVTIDTISLAPSPQKKDAADKGWSTAQAGATIKTDASKPSSFANIPKPSAVSTPAPTPKAAPVNFQQPQSVPQAPKAPIEAAPVMLQGTNFNSAPQKNSDFHLSKSGGEAQVEFGQVKSQAKVMPAIIEFPKPAAAQNTAQTTKTTPLTPPAPQRGAIHYTDFTPTQKTTPTMNSGSRNVTEITSNPTPIAMPPIPVVPKPPVTGTKPLMTAVPLPPKPPAPPTSPLPRTQTPPVPQPKVITKDFV